MAGDYVQSHTREPIARRTLIKAFAAVAAAAAVSPVGVAAAAPQDQPAPPVPGGSGPATPPTTTTSPPRDFKSRYPARSFLIESRPPRPFAASPPRVSQEGFEPTTKRLRVSCSTAELLAPSKWYRRASSPINQLVHQSVNLVRAKRGHSSVR